MARAGNGVEARSASQRFGEAVARAVAMAAQMSLLCPTGTAELMRRELSGDAGAGPRGRAVR